MPYAPVEPVERLTASPPGTTTLSGQRGVPSAMITCEREMPQIFRGAGNCSPSRSEAAMTLMSKPGNACQTANV